MKEAGVFSIPYVLRKVMFKVYGNEVHKWTLEGNEGEIKKNGENIIIIIMIFVVSTHNLVIII
jgi:hypothetical protein